MRSIDPTVTKIAALALGAVLLSGATGFAFAGWLDNGPAIFMAMVESGLSWCF